MTDLTPAHLALLDRITNPIPGALAAALREEIGILPARNAMTAESTQEGP